MKKILAVILLFILSASQVLACGPVITQVDKCEEYTYDYMSNDNPPEFERTKVMRDKISSYFYENIDLHQKSDFEKYVKIKERVELLLDSGEYKGSYYDVLCSAYVSMASYDSSAMNTSEDTVLVQQLRDNDNVDLYVYSYPQETFKLLYQNVEKVEQDDGVYINVNSDLSIFSAESRKAFSMLGDMYEESAYPSVTSYIEGNDKIIMSFIANRVPEVDKKYRFIGGVGIYKEGNFEFMSAGDLAVPNGDVDTYRTRYILDDETIIVGGKFCGYDGGTHILKDGSDILHEIK